jgi:ABC-2 type transport system permease protein
MPIFDQGYQHWTGELTSHAWRWLAITRHGVRVGIKNRLLRLVLMLAWLPAVGLGFMLCVWGLHEQKSPLVTPILAFLSFIPKEIVADPIQYRVEMWTLAYDFFLLTELRFSMLLILLVGPSLISQDLRFNALPLYFSRPLRRIDYFVGKLGVVAWFLGMVLIVPSLIAYILGLVFSLDLTIITDTFRLLLSCIGYGLVMTLSAGILILALSSLSRNSRYVALFWLAIWIVGGIVGTVMENVNKAHRQMSHYRQMSQVRYVGRPQPGAAPQTLQEQQAAQKAQQLEMQRITQEFHQQELDLAKTDWRPMFSYTANLARVGQEMLGTDASWKKLSLTRPPQERERYLLENMGSQYPWYWSAGVLAVLFGLSVCILNFRVKSLDRLR